MVNTNSPLTYLCRIGILINSHSKEKTIFEIYILFIIYYARLKTIESLIKKIITVEVYFYLKHFLFLIENVIPINGK